MKSIYIFGLFFGALFAQSEPQLGCSAYPGTDLVAGKARELCNLRDRICALGKVQTESIVLTKSMLSDLRTACSQASSPVPIEFSLSEKDADVDMKPLPDSTDVILTPKTNIRRHELLICLNSLLTKRARFIWTEIQDKPFLTDYDRKAFALITQNNDMQKFDYCR
ncbi:MAG TPA: hypothetical protein PLU50_06465 [Pseudobdellovibrionaceae bacterium]|nr:hypothetical protein [Pseudobdellovibrionaceae bacterium]